MKTNSIYQGDCLEVLKTLDDESVNCCVTSPPYYGLRDYGNAGQIGLEETPELYVTKMVEVFTEVKRVLKKDGTLWLNLGDSYWGGGWKGSKTDVTGSKQATNAGSLCGKDLKKDGKHDFIKTKDLIGIPWMIAFALRSAGWYLRQDIIWHKPNPMPESVTDRCTKAHEYIFLFSKSQKYYYDAEAIKQGLSDPLRTNWQSGSRINGINQDRNDNDFSDRSKDKTYESANKRSVWTVSVKPFLGSHFATFPEDLIVDCIKAGCPEGGIVLDPFMGAGTTAFVSIKLFRNFLGIELNDKYIKIAEKRLAKNLGIFNLLIKSI